MWLTNLDISEVPVHIYHQSLHIVILKESTTNYFLGERFRVDSILFPVIVGNYNLPSLDAAGLDVIIIGGGDTGVDCIGTSLRQVRCAVITLS